MAKKPERQQSVQGSGRAADGEIAVGACGRVSLPPAVVAALGVNAGDSLDYAIGAGVVTIRKTDGGTEDPALQPFLDLLARDLEGNPDRVSAVPAELRRRIRRLLLPSTNALDLDEPIVGPVSL